MPPDFRDEDAPVLMGESGGVPRGIPALVYFKTSGRSGEPQSCRWSPGGTAR